MSRGGKPRKSRSQRLKEWAAANPGKTLPVDWDKTDEQRQAESMLRSKEFTMSKTRGMRRGMVTRR